MDVQLRFFRAYFETRGTPTKIIGKIPYNSESELINDYYEILKPGVFTDTLNSGRDVKAYWNHDRSRVIGSTKAGTLKLTDAATGLKIELDLGQTSWGRDALEAVRRGDVSGFSFAFTPVKQEFSKDYSYRYIYKANLYEVSPTPEPAYSGSTAYARSKSHLTEIEDLRSHFSRDGRNEKMTRREKLEEIKQHWKTGGDYTNLRDMFAAAKNVAELGIPDDRLRTSGLGESVSSEGAFLLQPDFSRLLLKGPDISPIWDNCLKIPLSPVNYSIKIPTWQDDDRQAASFLGGLRFYFESEGDEIDTTHMKFAGLNMNLWKSTCLVPFTDELFQDAEGFEIIMRAGIQKAFNFMVEDKLINGKGHQEPLGCLHAPCKIIVPKETQDATTINATNIEKMILRMDPDNIYNYVWLASGTVQRELAKLTNETGTGGGSSPLFRYREGGQKYDQLAGRDIFYTSHCPNLGTEGDLIAVNLKSGYICTYKEQKRTISMHVRFVNDEGMYRVIFRWNAQPAVAKAITPVKGGATVSPVITLQTRS